MKTLWFCVIFYALCVQINRISTDSASDTLKFVNDLESKLNLTENQNITLVVGNTGSGKSTLVHYVAGNMSKLEAIQKDGSLDLIIRDGYDPENGDSTAAAVSRTLLPEMMIDEVGNVWWDTPGFGDTRNNTIEIATAFLIKRVLKSAQSVKLVLLASYFSISNDGSRDDFAQLIARTQQLVKNVTQFENSITLVVSKASPFFSWDPTKEVVEEDVQKVAAKFINGYRALLQQQGSNAEKIKFVDIFLKQAAPKQDYPNIAVFWRPNKLGRFDQIPKLANGRQKIRDTIIKQSTYAPIQQSDDFGFPLTSDAQMEVANLMKLTDTNIFNTLNTVVSQIKSGFLEKNKLTSDFKSKLAFIDIGQKSITVNDNTVAMTLDQVTAQLKVLIQALNLTSVDAKHFGECEKQQKNLQVFKSLINSENGAIVQNTNYAVFIKQMSDFFTAHSSEIKNQIQATDAETKKIVQTISSILTNIDRQIMDTLEKKLQSIDAVQQRYTWIQLGNKILAMDNNKMDTLKQRTELLMHQVHAFDAASINTATLNQIDQMETRLNVLNSTWPTASVNWILVSSTSYNYLRSTINWYTFLTQTFTALAQYDVQKDIAAYIQNQLPNLCKRSAEFGASPFHLTEFEEMVSVTLKSPPKYECINKIMIIKGNFVKSSDIQPEKCATQNPLQKIKVFVTETFYVDSDLNFVNIEEIEMQIFAHQWTILRASVFHLNGKDGAVGTLSGKNGGNFFGVALKVVSGDLLTVDLNGGNGVNDGDHQKLATVNIQPHRTEHAPIVAHLQSISGVNGVALQTDVDGVRTYKLFASQCCGGKGALSGHYAFNYIGAEAGATLPKNTLTNGKSCETFDIFVEVTILQVRSAVRRPNPSCPVYNPATNPAGKQQIDVAAALLEYKVFLTENMKYATLVDTIRKTYNAIDLKVYQPLAYKVDTFVSEVNTLEKHYYRLNGNYALIMIYDSLVKKVENFSATIIADLDRKIIALIYSVIFGKTTSIRHGSDLIVDIEIFLEVTIQNIKELNEIARKQRVDELRDEYNSGLVKKTEEAVHFIKDDLEPEIEKMFKVLDNELNNTLTETIDLQHRADIEIERKKELYNEYERKMKRNIAQRKRAGIFRAIGGIASFIPVIGPVIGAAIGAAVPEVPPMADPAQRPPFTVPFGVTKYLSELSKSNKDQVSAIEEELNALKKLNEGNADFGRMLNDLMTDIGMIKQKESLHYGHVADILKRANSFLETASKNKLLSPKMVEGVQNATKAITVIAQAFSVYQQFKSDTARLHANLNQLAQAINADQNTLKSLMMFEVKIYTELWPLIEALHKHLNDVEGGLADKSSVALLVVHRKVSKTLRAVQVELKMALDGFGSEHSVDFTLVDISEAIGLILNIFDRVQQYYEHKDFANYLTDVYTTDYKSLPITDQNLRNNVAELQFNLQANLILSQYHRAVGAFKQAIFPYADMYLNSYGLSIAFQGNGIADVTTAAAQNIQSLKKHIKEFNTTVVNKYDERIHVAEFNNDAGSPGPFFVWPKNDVREKIKRLFNGEKIYLFADISRSIKSNGIKFNQVNFVFNSHNLTTNAQFEEILKTFHLHLTHMGESDYRCDNEVYTISSRPLTCKYSFDEKNHIPTDETVSCRKLRQGIAELSPYTLWAIQLDCGQLNQLKPFVDMLDIELHGRGQYLEGETKICKTNLTKYYSKKNSNNQNTE